MWSGMFLMSEKSPEAGPTLLSNGGLVCPWVMTLFTLIQAK